MKYWQIAAGSSGRVDVILSLIGQCFKSGDNAELVVTQSPEFAARVLPLSRSQMLDIARLR